MPISAHGYKFTATWKVLSTQLPHTLPTTQTPPVVCLRARVTLFLRSLQTHGSIFNEALVFPEGTVPNGSPFVFGSGRGGEQPSPCVLSDLRVCGEKAWSVESVQARFEATSSRFSTSLLRRMLQVRAGLVCVVACAWWGGHGHGGAGGGVGKEKAPVCAW